MEHTESHKFRACTNPFLLEEQRFISILIIGHFSKWDKFAVGTDIRNDIRISLLVSITTNKMRMKP